ncbi:MAG TPA: DinB family protein [Ignavibacteriaceae bacterium]|nr:DinB family protein [Ignavibacteriaceae bacterium]
MKEYFLELFKYNSWANERVFESLAQFESPPEKAVELLSHIYNSQEIWLSRIKARKAGAENPWQKHSFEKCIELLRQCGDEWFSFLNNLKIGEENAEFEYRNTKGEKFNNKIKDAIIQVINHSTYHRAQIASLVRNAGGNPAVTDYIVFKR